MIFPQGGPNRGFGWRRPVPRIPVSGSQPNPNTKPWFGVPPPSSPLDSIPTDSPGHFLVAPPFTQTPPPGSVMTDSPGHFIIDPNDPGFNYTGGGQDQGGFGWRSSPQQIPIEGGQQMLPPFNPNSQVLNPPSSLGGGSGGYDPFEGVGGGGHSSNPWAGIGGGGQGHPRGYGLGPIDFPPADMGPEGEPTVQTSDPNQGTVPVGSIRPRRGVRRPSPVPAAIPGFGPTVPTPYTGPSGFHNYTPGQPFFGPGGSISGWGHDAGGGSYQNFALGRGFGGPGGFLSMPTGHNSRAIGGDFGWL